MSLIRHDQAGEIRSGEQPDYDAIESYLRAHNAELEGEMKIQQFGGGASNLTYLISFDNLECVMRRPPYGAQIKSAHDMGREYRVLNALSKHYAKAPKPLHYEESGTVLGCQFYIMERVHGVILRHKDGSDGSIPPSMVANIADGLMDTLAELHALDYKEVGLGDLGRPEGYVKRQVEGWTKRYMKAKTEEVDSIEFIAKWLAQEMPAETHASVIHNDYKHDNLVLNEDHLSEVKAILDWEMCTIGDPLMDMGTVLSYWINPEDHPALKKNFPNPSALPGNPNRSQLLALYESKTGRSMDNPVFYYAFGLFKTAVILQQIYARFKLGHTNDERFANFDQAVQAFGLMGQQAIQKNQLDDLF
ncbi:MAG: aminoglycoside phosphotransferase (APT) family kinase protein [Saprospiraceae bacterium]|jgi:aminoglycoside phosphotransferase (APT) family kinase protein